MNEKEELEELDLFTWAEEDLAKPLEQSPQFDYMKSIGNNFKKIKEKDKKFNEAINNKVDKQNGKDLSTNDFTDAYKQKVDDLENYDDTAIIQDITNIKAEQEAQNTDIEALETSISEINEKNDTQDLELAKLQQENIELKKTQDDMIEKSLNKQTEADTSLIVKDADNFYRKIEHNTAKQAR